MKNIDEKQVKKYMSKFILYLMLPPNESIFKTIIVDANRSNQILNSYNNIDVMVCTCMHLLCCTYGSIVWDNIHAIDTSVANIYTRVSMHWNFSPLKNTFFFRLCAKYTVVLSSIAHLYR